MRIWRVYKLKPHKENDRYVGHFHDLDAAVEFAARQPAPSCYVKECWLENPTILKCCQNLKTT
jgi:hypothetical protein